LGALRADAAASETITSSTNTKKCLVPTKCVHRCANAHEKGVHRIRLFPVTGHLLLSAGLDGKCKVFRFEEATNTSLQLMRTYIGHSAAVRDVQFNQNGKQFVSASFDRYLRLWDTETGQVLQTFTNRKVPYVVQLYPFDDRFFVVGCSDRTVFCGTIVGQYHRGISIGRQICLAEKRNFLVTSFWPFLPMANF
jgi:pre-mRNA-processing factor 17